MARLYLTAPLIVLVAACGQDNGSQSDTKITNVEIVKGTASDEMILLDTSQGDGTAVDTSATGDLYETVDNRPTSEDGAAQRREAPKTVSPLDIAKGTGESEVKMVEPVTPPAPPPAAPPPPAKPEK